MKSNKIYWIVLSVLTLLFVYFRSQEYSSYLKYNNMSGTVIDTYTSQGRYGSTELPTIRLEDGSVGSINGGHHHWKIGETFINKITFTWIFGMYGTAYFIDPNKNILKTIFCLLVLFMWCCKILFILIVKAGRIIESCQKT